MSEVSGHQVLSLSRLGAFQKNMVIRIGTCLDGLRGTGPKSPFRGSLEVCGNDVLRPFKAWPADDFFVSGIYTSADAELNRTAERPHENLDGPRG